MTTNTLKTGVIGLGNMGRHHVRNYFELEQSTLTAVMDPNNETATKYATQYNCNAYSNLDEMLEKESLDAVTITAPTSLHYQIAKQVIQKGIHVLIEKPISDTLETAEELIQLSQKHNVTLMVGHIERFNPAIIKLKEIIDSGQLGKITSLISKRIGMFPTQIKDANVMIDLAVHDIDIFSYLLGKQPDKVHSNSGRALITDREDYAELFLTYADQSGYIQVNWITPVRIRNLAITGTKGYAELNYMTQELDLYKTDYTSTKQTDGSTSISFNESTKQPQTFEKKEPLAAELSHFLNCIQENKTPITPGKHGHNALKIALNAMK